MRLAREKGLPPMRPLFFNYPVDANCYEIDDSFLLGEELLIAPVVEKDARVVRFIYQQ